MPQVKNIFSQKGFTLVELLAIVGVLVILAGLGIPAFRNFERRSELDRTAESIANVLRLAQSKTVASEESDQWGVYFSTSSNQYILFRGDDYSSRDPLYDEIKEFSQNIEIKEINTNTGTSQIVFERLTGAAGAYGHISLKLKSESSEKLVYVENSGLIGLAVPPVVSEENRLKDSRRVYIDYGRLISTSTEKIVLTFDGTVVEEIPIADNLAEGQINFEREVTVGGQNEKVKIYTNRLNDPDTQFSVVRDRRYNSKSLRVDIDNVPDYDAGYLVQYSADGLTTTSTSIYVADLQWQ